MRVYRFVPAAACAALLAATSPASSTIAPATDSPLAFANLGNDNITGAGFGATCRSFNPEAPGHWGGEFGDGAVTAFPGDPDPAAYCTFNWHDGGWFARRIELRVLDGIGEDRFEVFVKNPAGKWVRVYQYTGRYDTEHWIVHTIDTFPAGKGQGAQLELKIVPGIVEWPGFPIWGSLAVDYIAVYEGRAQSVRRQPIGHLYLHEKDSDWRVVEKGAWGRMQYRRAGPQFVYALNAHRLMPSTQYTLIYYADPWASPKTCLGRGTSNEHGDLHMMEAVDTGDLPAAYDDNYPGGAKIWLVLSSHVDCDARRMTGWKPEEYLFESRLITFKNPAD